MIISAPLGRERFPAIAFQVQTISSESQRRSDEDSFSTASLIENLEDVVLAGAKEHLNSLARLSRGNDDEHGAAPNSETIERSRYLLKLLFSGVSNSGLQWREPLISATWEGDVVFEWWKRERKIALYVHQDEVSFVRVAEVDGKLSIDDGQMGEIALMDLWTWLTTS